MTAIYAILEKADVEAFAQISAPNLWPGIPGAGVPVGDSAVQLLLHYLLLEPHQQQPYPLAAMLTACPSHEGLAWDQAPALTHADVRALIQMMRHHQAWVTDERNHPRQLPSVEVNQSALRAFKALDEGLAKSTFRNMILSNLCRPWDELESGLTAPIRDAPYRHHAACLVADFRALGLSTGGWHRLGSLETLLDLLHDDPERRWRQAISPHPIHPRAQHPEVMRARLSREVWEAIEAGRHTVDEPEVVRGYPEVLARWRAQQLIEHPAQAPGRRRHRS